MAITAADAQELIRCFKSNRDLSQLEAWGMFQWQVGRCEDLRSREERDDPEDEPWQCGAWRVTSDPSAEGEGYLKWGPKEPPRLPSDLDPEWEMSYTRRPPVWQHYREPAPQIPSNGREVISAPYIRAVQMKRSRASIRVLMLQRLHSLRIRLTVISPSVCTPYSIPSLLSQSLVSNPHIQTQNKFSGANGFGGSLCSSCANTPFQKLLHFQTIKYRLLSNVSASGRRLCKLCEMVDEIAGAGDRSEERILDLYFESQSPVFLHRVNHVPHAKFVSPASIDVKNKSISTPYHLLPHPIGSLAVLPEAGSEYHLSLLRIWLQQCQESHDHSVPHQLLPAPSRLLDIGDLDRTGTVCLRDSLSPGTKYVALSHRWGISQPVITTKENLNERQKGIQFFQLPKTFQDAVVVTRGLGIHHLWIDSLCIVQNDPEDWQREAKKMEEVFSFAHCTISATSASGCHQGFLHRSPGNSVRVLSLNDNPPIGVWFTRLPSNFKHDVESSVLNQRAWVFQERALSLRNIHFTASQTYFQCEAGVWCETTGKTKIRGSVNDWLRPIAMANASLSTAVAKRLNGPKSLFPIPFSHLRHDPTDAFMHYLSYYSRLAITKQSDRPLAILGLESRLAVSMRAISLYGVLISSFCRTLFWHRLGDLPLKRIDFAHDLVPSWSWMHYEGAINYGMLQGTISSKYIAWGGDIRLNNAGMIAPVQENRFSILVPVSLLTKNCVVRRGRMQQEVTHGGEVVAWIRRDDPDEEEDLRDLRSVIVGQVSNTLGEDHSSLDELQRSRSYWSCVLLVRPFYKGNQAVKETYQRVGVGIVRTKHLSPDKQVDRVWVV